MKKNIYLFGFCCFLFGCITKNKLNYPITYNYIHKSMYANNGDVIRFRKNGEVIVCIDGGYHKGKYKFCEDSIFIITEAVNVGHFDFVRSYLPSCFIIKNKKTLLRCTPMKEGRYLPLYEDGKETFTKFSLLKPHMLGKYCDSLLVE